MVQVEDIPTRWNTEYQIMMSSESSESETSVTMQNMLKGNQLNSSEVFNSLDFSRSNLTRKMRETERRIQLVFFCLSQIVAF